MRDAPAEPAQLSRCLGLVVLSATSGKFGLGANESRHRFRSTRGAGGRPASLELAASRFDAVARLSGCLGGTRCQVRGPKVVAPRRSHRRPGPESGSPGKAIRRSVRGGQITIAVAPAGTKQRLVVEELERHHTGVHLQIGEHLVYSDVIEL